MLELHYVVCVYIGGEGSDECRRNAIRLEKSGRRFRIVTKYLYFVTLACKCELGWVVIIAVANNNDGCVMFDLIFRMREITRSEISR